MALRIFLTHISPGHLSLLLWFIMIKAKGSADDITPGDIQKPERAAGVGSGRSWVDMSTKVCDMYVFLTYTCMIFL